MISFAPLWETMRRKNVTIYALINKHNFSRGLLHKLKHDGNVTLETVGRLCDILDCRIEDVAVFIKDKE